MSGPVLSHLNHPNNQLALVGGLSHGMMQGFHSSHVPHMYGHHHPPPPPNPPNDRPFRCDQCPQSFNRNHDLKRHKRIHLAVKPFPCGHCDKSFSRKDALKVGLLFPRPSSLSVFISAHLLTHEKNRGTCSSKVAAKLRRSASGN